MTRRAPGDGSVRQISEHRFEARAYFPDGKRRSFYGATAKAASKAMRDAMAEADKGHLPVSPKLLTAEYLEDWLKAVEPTVRPTTFNNYRQYVRNYLVPQLGHKPLGKLTPADVETAMHSNPELAPRTRNTIRVVMRIALGRAVRHGTLSRNVAELASSMWVPDDPPPAFTPDEVRAFLGALDGHPFGPLYTVALTYGLRMGECFGLRWQDVDFETGSVTVRQQYQRLKGRGLITEPKTRSARRTFPRIETGLRALRQESARQKERRLGAGEFWQATDLVFTRGDGQPMTHSTVNRALHEICRAEKLQDLSFHGLRHSCATLHLVVGTSMKVVQELLGHSSIRITSDTYSHVVPVLMGDAAARLDDALGTARKSV